MCAAALALAASGAAAQDATPSPDSDRPKYLQNPKWAQSPLPAFPESALAAELRDGRVEMDCAIERDGSLSDCRAEAETPAGLGLRDLALVAAANARLDKPVDMDNVRTRYIVRYLAPEPTTRIDYPPSLPVTPPMPPAPPRAQIVTSPSYQRAPRPTFPASALSRGVTDSLVGASCRIAAYGALANCEIIHEQHPGLGFRTAALEALSAARVSPRTADSAVPNATVLIWLPFNAEDGGG